MVNDIFDLLGDIMDITQITQEIILSRLDILCLRLIDTKDFTASQQAETLKQELEYYFEAQRQKEI
jgi:hypothetical protein